MYVIGSDEHGYYTGSGWSTELAEAKRYDRSEDAESVINRHKMPALPYEASTLESAESKDGDNANGSAAF